MKKLFNQYLVPCWAILFGGLGYGVQLWLQQSGLDEKGLYISGHIAAVLSFVLIPIALGILALSAKPFKKAPKEALPAACPFLRFAGFIAAAVLLFHGITGIMAGISGLEGVFALFSFPCAVLMATATGLHLAGKKPSYLLYAGITVYLLLFFSNSYRHWSADPQLLNYFFPLIATVFSLLASYQRTCIAAGEGNKNTTLFFWYGALFFCLMALPTGNILIGGILFWLLADGYLPVREETCHEAA